MGGTPARFRGKVVLEEFSAVTGNKGAVSVDHAAEVERVGTVFAEADWKSFVGVTDRAQAVYLSSSFVLGLLNRSLGFVGLLKSIFLTACDVDGALNLENLKHGLADSTKNGTSGPMSLNKAWKLERVLESVAWRIHDW
ncbi:hypothetical protein Bca52824_026643 [Brassica carinata]|uniref:Uncharacterized protein n=1 Tax=Brassica carinata TaxID=52824 RepID=A0A8X7SK02_BRACI|nr:hypothetical protein Bca52824_026643 [Brassica carinata]